MIRIDKSGIEEIPVIQDLAKRIWNIVYTDIIGREQIDYMLNLMYSDQNLKDQIENQGHQFLIVSEDMTPLGFAAYSPKSDTDPTIFRLHKLYVLPNQHGKGLGKKLLEKVGNEVQVLGAKSLELNVNKKNPAIGFYEKMGFVKDREMVLDIGNGYVMDDFVMTLQY